MESKIIICSHAQDIKGIQQSAILRKLELNLKNYGKNFQTLVHSMNIAQKSFLYDSEKETITRVGYAIKVSVFRYLYEIILNVIFLRKQSKKNKNLKYIGIDPLNALSGVIAKKFGYIEKNIFYTPDYSPQKFKNSFLNKIYHAIDSFCLKHCDEVWNVSSRIYEIRKKQGVNEEKNFFLPNVPGNIDIQIDFKNKEKFSLITSGTLNIHLDYETLIDSVGVLKNDFPKIKLYIAGDGPLREEVKQYIQKKGLGESVILLGFMEVSEYLLQVSKSGVGVAMYNGKWAFNYYGDSTKCREFMYFGLPILTTSFHSTADEIKENNAGIIDDSGKTESYISSIKTIFAQYDDFSKNSLKLGKENNLLYTDKIGNL